METIMMRIFGLTTALMLCTMPAYSQDEFADPTFEEIPLDWCYLPSERCGKEAADRFCRMQNDKYVRAARWEKKVNLRRTIILGTHDVCDRTKFNRCDGFKVIECETRTTRFD